MNKLKQAVINAIDGLADTYINAGHDIAKQPETGCSERFAAKTLTGLLQKSGFKISSNIAGYETGFIAEAGEGDPAIAFLAEYDALPELGHACGHNIIGAQSSLAAAGLRAVLGECGGRVIVFGSPAEEGGDGGCAKAAFADQGLFKDVSAALMAHPGSGSFASPTPATLAVKCHQFEFFGKTAHAAQAPENGVNALDAMILFFNGVALLRQQTTEDTRIHGVITHGGDVPNIIPGYAKAKFYVRNATKAAAAENLERLINIAKGAAMATGCTFKESKFCNDYDDIVRTPVFDALFKETAGEFGFTFEETLKAARFGSTDAGNVSYRVPLIQPLLPVAPDGCKIHTTAFAEAAVSPMADKTLVNGAKALAVTGLRLLTDKDKLAEIANGHKQALAERMITC